MLAMLRPEYFPVVVVSLKHAAIILGGLLFVALCLFIAECIEQANIGRDIDDEGGGK